MTAAAVVCDDAAWADIRAHAAAAWPREACGLLIGRRDEADGVVRFRIVEARAAANLADAADRFELDPAARIAAQRQLREAGAGLAVLGAYHSHPDGPARPSATDTARAGEEGLLWLIVAATAAGAGDAAAFIAVAGPRLAPVAFAVGPAR